MDLSEGPRCECGPRVWGGCEQGREEACAESRPVTDRGPQGCRLHSRQLCVTGEWAEPRLRELVILWTESPKVANQLPGSIHGTPARREEAQG